MKIVRAGNVEDDVDALFKLPLAEFTGARNALATRLKKSGRGDEAARVKALGKPPVSAWAVNQLFWNHRDHFDQLIAAGERFHKAQTSRSATKATDMREALDARREALTHLSDLATSLLQDAGSNPSLDTVRRITTTLEAMSAVSARASRSDGPQAGRLTQDVDPPGFESFASFVPGMRSAVPAAASGATSDKQKKTTHSSAAARAADSTTTKTVQADNLRRIEEGRKAKIAAVKVSLQAAKKSLAQAQARAKNLEAAQKKAETESKKAEKQRRDAEAILAKAKAAAEAAAERAQSVATEVEESASEVEDAERTVEEATEELESLLRE